MLLKKILNSKKFFIILVLIESFVVYHYIVKTYLLRKENNDIQNKVAELRSLVYNNIEDISDLKRKIEISIEDISKKIDTTKDKNSQDSKVLYDKMENLNILYEQINSDFSEFNKQVQGFCVIIGTKQCDNNSKIDCEELDNILQNLKNSQEDIKSKIKTHKETYNKIESTGIHTEEDTQDEDNDNTSEGDDTEVKSEVQGKDDNLDGSIEEEKMKDNQNDTMEGYNILKSDHDNDQNNVSNVENNDVVNDRMLKDNTKEGSPIIDNTKGVEGGKDIEDNKNNVTLDSNDSLENMK